MKKFLFYIVVCVVFSSCFLLKKYEQTSFTYTENNQNYTLPIIVPRGYKKVNTTSDTVGNTHRVYEYAKGPLLYISYLRDTTKQLFPLQKQINQPQIHKLGGLIYKGVDLDLKFWRQIRRKNFHFGYRDVPLNSEIKYDSAINYMSLQKLN